MSMTVWTVFLSFFLVLGASDARSPHKKEPKLTSLSESLGPLAERFNDDKDQVRVLALLSPT